MEPIIWPFRPVHITNDGEKHPEGSDLKKLYGVGIIPNHYVQGLQAAAADSLRNSSTIVEFPVDPGEAPVRTDSSTRRLDWNPACILFRQFTNNGSLCAQCDRVHAALFRGAKQDELASLVRARAAASEYIREHFRGAGAEWELVNVQHRPFLQYNCPFLGYRELIFPLFFEQCVIAVLFVGQIILKERLKFIQAQQKAFFRPHPKCQGYEKQLSAKHNEWVGDGHVLATNQYNDLIASAHQEIHTLESRLAAEMQNRRARWVDERVQGQIQKLDRQIRKPSAAIPARGDPMLLGDEGLHSLWNIVSERFDEARKDLSLKYIIVFGISRIPGPAEGMPETLDAVVAVGDTNAICPGGCDQLKYSLASLPEGVGGRSLTSIDQPLLFDGVQGGTIDRNCTMIRLFPGPLLPQSLVVACIGYDPDTWNALTDVDRAAGQSLNASLSTFYHVLVSSLASLVAVTAERRMKDTIRALGHEIRQLNSGVDVLRTRYFSEPGTLRHLPQERLHKIGSSLDGYLEQARFLFDNADVLTSAVPEPKCELFDAMPLLIKWAEMNQTDAEEKPLGFDIPHPRPNDPLYAPIYADPILFEQLLYNLIGNAVKYSHRGTQIYINCAKTSPDDNSPHVLSVIDYGLRVENADRLYQLYSRGANVQTAAGLGLGLYHSRRIAEAHGGTISHDCRPTPISQYNIPLIEPYVSRQFPGKDPRLAENLRHEIDRLRQAHVLQKVVATDVGGNPLYAKPTLDALKNGIKQPTFKVAFQIVFPPSKGDSR